MTENGANSRNEGEAQLAGHDEFLQLCALATSDSLSEDEWVKLQEHLAKCDVCSSALRDYQKITREGMGALASEFALESVPAVSSNSIESTKRKLFDRISLEIDDHGSGSVPVAGHSGGTSRNDDTRITSRNTQFVLRCAAAIAIVAGLTATAYRLGERKNSALNTSIQSAATQQEGSLQKEVSNLTQEHQSLIAQLHGREQDLESLKIVLGQKSDEISNLKQKQQSLEDVALKAGDEKTAIALERDAISQQLMAAQANAATIQAQLNDLQGSVMGI